ncbi:MAG: serine protease [Ferruginibacter sp.]
MKIIVLLILFFSTFRQTTTGQSNINEIKFTNENESTIKAYVDSVSVDPIEGIYKSVSENNYYKIAIKKYSDKYLAIILDSKDKKHWKVGAVKGYFEKTSLENVYSIKWLMGDKTSQETIGRLENETTLKILLPTGENGSNQEIIFFKMYPAYNSSTGKNIHDITITGSGFFVSSKGLIATNAHVVNGAKKIEIKVPNDIGSNYYSAKTLLIDTRNDVAIIQIDDSSFKELNPLPYGISEKADIGEKTFTIGYPLNDIMGTNYKVTDGIISAKSGVSDDIRYYQVTIPLQPGNSGGPLFNSQGNIIGITSAKLSSKAAGVSIENVNYAIKAAYLATLISMIPNFIVPVPTTQLASKELKDQVKVLKNYVCLIQATE